MGCDKINKVILDLNKQTQREKFKEFIEELLDTIPIENIIFEMTRGRVTKELLEQVDQDISFIFNKVKNKIERQ